MSRSGTMEGTKLTFLSLKIKGFKLFRGEGTDSPSPLFPLSGARIALFCILGVKARGR